MSDQNKIVLVSACLAGVECRYDCASKENIKIIEMVNNGQAIPVCPEQLGGLSTPRDPAENINDKVMTIKGKDVTVQYKKGSDEAIKIAIMAGVSKAYLKSKSPMCGVHQIYDGNFKGKLVNGQGIFAKALKKLGIHIEEVD